jgi:threonine/homoserine/homoserine lactone efflux protein
MNTLLLFLLAAGLGFAAAIPIGGSQIEMAKRAIGGHVGAAGMVILGSVSSDILYGVIAVFGIAPYMEAPWVLAAFNAAGAVILWSLAVVTLRQSRKPAGIDWQHASLKSHRLAWVTGFSLAFSNPPMIIVWLLGVTLAKQFGLASPFTVSAKVIYISGGALGLAGYLTALGVVMHRIKHVIPVHALGRIYHWLGITLILLSCYFVYGVVRFFLGGG